MNQFRTYDLAVAFYQQCRQARLPAHLKIQLARASSSIALNLQEGRGRGTRADQLRFFQIAMGSVRECQAIYQLERNSFSREAPQLLDRLAASCFLLIRNAR